MSPEPYLDPDRSLDERVADLIGRLTREEKIGQLMHNSAAIPRLNIPAYNYWSEALHGVARNGRATVFPQAIGMAATWDPDLIRRVASAVGDEGRAKYHAALRRAGRTIWYQGLHFWSPNVNLFRDPRWGRGQETWGEDPYLTGTMGSAFVQGLQGDHPTYLKAVACAKHYAVHSGPERLRHTLDAQASPRDLHDTYLPAFKKLVTEGRVESVMGAYNRVNGHAAVAHPVLLGEMLRGAWGFEGHVVSDCGAVRDIFSGHHVAQDLAEAAAIALKAGCDLECGDAYKHLGEAIERGLVTEADLDQALSRVLRSRFKLGMFDPDERVPYASIPESVVGSDEHRALARQAALESIVLLKNKGGVLPLRDVHKLYVTGPTASNLEVLLGNYYGINGSLTTLLEGIVGRVPEGVRLEYRAGVQLLHESPSKAEWIAKEAAAADVAIVCVGVTPLMEGEEGEALASKTNGDRSEIGLPAVQVEFVRRIATAGGRVVLIVTGGSPVALGDLVELVDAILFVWYPGQEGGRAVADVIFGDASPSGRLPLTFPTGLEQLPPFEDYGMAGRTYRYLTQDPLFPFGFGLSYSRFAYSDLRCIVDGVAVDVSATVTNTGSIAADEVAQCYLSDLAASAPVPQHKLVAFERVHLGPGERRDLLFRLGAEALEFINEAGQAVLEPGEFRVVVGGCSPGRRGRELGAAESASVVFEIRSVTA